jgi:hypothetical protein
VSASESAIIGMSGSFGGAIGIVEGKQSRLIDDLDLEFESI